MRFHLDHKPKKTEFAISHFHKIFMLGSCFTENIGTYLEAGRFRTCINPGGILFNPTSICKHINTLISGELMDEKDILQQSGIFFSYMHHSSVHNENKHDLVKKINSENKKASFFLKETDYLFITFGSAYVYRHLLLNAVVSNCHKQPGHNFEKSLLSVEKIVEDYSGTLKKLKDLNPALKIIFTVSPVKHLRDGLTENNLSKATLLLSIHHLIKKFDFCFYFPAFELVTDDLRDYRFYKEDLAHPNEQALAYVWEKFSACYFSEETLLLNQQIKKLSLALSHRSMVQNSTEAIKLNNFIITQKEEIKKNHPFINF